MTRETICLVKKGSKQNLCWQLYLIHGVNNFNVQCGAALEKISKMLRLLPRRTIFQNNVFKSFHASASCRLKEIIVDKKDEKTTIIDSRFVDSPKKPFVIKLEDSDKCPLCQLNLNLKYTDVLILCQYLDSKGNILLHKHTKLCKSQYKLVTELIHMAQHAGLLPEPPREEPKKPYQLLNTYYDETTIKLYSAKKKHHLKFYYLSSKLSPIERRRLQPNVGTYYGPKK